ncbi:cache domain-containing protein [Methylobacterium nigriterrae]|uniref:cache domain-containing protein n=1 Tax=Methylobacterium nigriterrae TaxID=3127512 RepID=UPI0030139978
MPDLSELDAYLAEGARLIRRAEECTSRLHQDGACEGHRLMAEATHVAMQRVYRLIEARRGPSAADPMPAPVTPPPQETRRWWPVVRRDVLRCIPLCIAFVMVTAANSADLQQPPGGEGQAARIEAMVNKAAALVEARGKAAFSEFRKRNSEWRFDDVYLFVSDLNGRVLLNVEFPQREGTDQLKEKDADGKSFHEDFIEVVRSDGSGWVDYMFPKPGQRYPSEKWSYVRATTIDGMPGLIGAGFYTD